MDSQPKQPKQAHKKEVSSRERGMRDFDAPKEDRRIGNGSTLKFGTQVNISELPSRGNVELLPRPSSSCVDPLVRIFNRIME